MSVVVHDTPNGNVKMLCANLHAATEYSGRFTQLSSYSGSGYGSPQGTATLTVESVGMVSTVVVYGGTGMAGLTFNAHLHASRCGDNQGGPHYQDPGNPGVVDAVSEMWPTLVCNGTGYCTGGASSTWVATLAALNSGLSIVVHDTPGGTGGSGPKWLCADLAVQQVIGSSGESDDV